MLTKLCVAAVLITLLGATASAQQPPDERSRVRTAERQVHIGLTLIAAGALVMPATYLVSDQLRSGPAVTGVGLMMAGGCVVFLGMKDRQKAVRPAVTAVVNVSESRAAVQFRKTW